MVPPSASVAERIPTVALAPAFSLTEVLVRLMLVGATAEVVKLFTVPLVVPALLVAHAR